MHQPRSRGVTLRTARPSDVDRLGALVRATFVSTYHHLPDDCVEPHLAEAAGPTAIAPSVRLDTRAVSVVERPDGELVGFAHAFPAVHAAASGKRPLMLSQVYLLPEHHGVGAGSALMRRTERWAIERGHDELWLTVWAGNTRAIGFYAAHGLRTVGATPVRIGRCTDLDLVMSKALVR